MSTNHGNTSRRRVSAVHGLARFCTLGRWPTPFIRAVFFCGWIGFGLTALAQDQGTFKRLELKESVLKGLSLPPGDPLNEVKVSIELDTVQPDVGEGIVFFVDIVNEGSAPIDLLDPTELFSVGRKCVSPTTRMGVGLRRGADPDQQGIYVNLPRPRGPHQTADPEGFKARWEARRSFNLTEVPSEERQAGEKSIGDVKNGEIRLESGEHFQYYVEITKIMGDPERYRADKERRYGQPPDVRLPPLDPPQIIPIRADTYTLFVSVSLATPGPAESASRSGRSSNWIPVRLGSNPNPPE